MESIIEKKIKAITIKRRNLRTQKKHSQEYVGDRLGIRQIAYHKLENGKTILKVEIMLKLAVILGVGDNYFMEECVYVFINGK
ncbi:helix-turn-helix domain-containing protein [Polaribacter sp. IC073]|uniref:helix-turn-helix domain-containing protein n=1 Tax=Polaribacter sp. IC073 TaxID=2508540 RepID=UPI0011BE29A8|nr:helix-turn-helix transcriptional regulator [Polaribacter sp. IC073]TXD47245.1 helix-turn-helix transcriptional regulator [Polaribacter sp. IC073]